MGLATGVLIRRLCCRLSWCNRMGHVSANKSIESRSLAIAMSQGPGGRTVHGRGHDRHAARLRRMYDVHRLRDLVARSLCVVTIALVCASCGSGTAVVTGKIRSGFSTGPPPYDPSLGPSDLQGPTVLPPDIASAENCSTLPTLIVPTGLDQDPCREAALVVSKVPCTATSGAGDQFYFVKVGRGAYYGRSGQMWRQANSAQAKHSDRLARSVGCP
jgi:hypothetical protein